MDIPPLALTGQPPPIHAADLRPAADAAALMRDPRAAGATTSVLLAPAVQMAEVSRSLIASSAGESPSAVARAERVLKPWGVAMLPSTPGDNPAKATIARKVMAAEDTG